MEFSERLRQLREKHGYTQKQLADFQFDYEINTDKIKQENRAKDFLYPFFVVYIKLIRFVNKFQLLVYFLI